MLRGMPRASLCCPVLSIALLAACPPGGQDSGTSSGPGTTTGSTGSTATDATSASGTGPTVTGDPTTSGTAGSSSTSDSTTNPVSSTTDPSTTDPSTTGSSTTGPDTSTSDTSTSDSSTSDSSTSDSSTSDTTGTTTGDSSSTGDDIPDTTGGEVCGPGANLTVEWSLEVPPHLAGKDLAVTCLIVSTEVQEPKTTVNLSCTIDNIQEDVALHFSLKPFHQYLFIKDQLVNLNYRTAPAPWNREWLKFVSTYAKIWGVRADSLAPPGIAPSDYYNTDVELGAPCDPEPDPCGSRQGLEVRFKHDFGGMDVWAGVRSGQTDVFGFPVANRVFLPHISRLLEPIGCDDVAPVTIDMVVVEDHSGF